MNINIKCPQCNKEIGVVSTTGLEKKVAECPHCKTKMNIGEFLPKFSLKVGDKSYQLHFGRQWIGRKKEGNDADIQIEDKAGYMSKKHAAVELTCSASGIVCTFEEHGKNPTTLQGIELVNDDIVYLNISDCLKLGDKRMYLANEYGQ